MGLWAIVSDPFRISSATDHAISNEYADVYSRFFPVDAPPLTVVTIDSKSLGELYSGGRGKISVPDWPVSYDDHAAFLSKIAQGKPYPPVAIFYDIFFEIPRESSGDLSRLNRRVSRIQQVTKIPIFFAAGGPDMLLSDDSRDVLSGPSLVRTNWHEPSGSYPLVLDDKQFVSSDESLTEGENRVGQRTPALELYQLYCAASLTCDDSEFDEEVYERRLSIHWPMAETSFAGLSSTKCAGEGFIARVLNVGARVLDSIFNAFFWNVEGPRSASPQCLPIHTVQISDLFSNNHPVDLSPPNLKPDEPYVVMVGVTMPSAGDYHSTPVYEKVAGIFVHAAAFENLYRMGADFFYHRDLTWFAVAVWLLASLGMMIHARCRRRLRRMGRMPVFLIWWFVLIFAVLSMQVIFNSFFRLVPEGWLSMVAILPLLREVVMRNEAAVLKKKEKN